MKINFREVAVYAIAGALLLTVFAVAFGQHINYSTKPAGDKAEVVKMHLALALLDGKWNPAQEEFLLRGIEDATTISQSEAALLFSPKDSLEVFYKIGTRNIDEYREVYALNVLADKKRYVTSLDPESRTKVWRTHWAHEIATKSLSNKQIRFLLRASKGIDDLRTAAKLGEESLKLFDRELGRELFGTIGPYTEEGDFCGDSKKPTTRVGNCVCNVNGTNWSCNDACASSTSCTEVDGCGFAWLFRCNGMCDTGTKEGFVFRRRLLSEGD